MDPAPIAPKPAPRTSSAGDSGQQAGSGQWAIPQLDPHTFQVLPRRWVVERTFGWIMKHRRCVRDYERLPEHHETYLYWSMINVMAARVARSQSPARPPAPSPALLQAA